MAKKRILIVEDEVVFAKALQTQLTRLGFVVTGIATNSAEALRQAEKDRPDLALMDIRLENSAMDGIETAAQLDARFDIPVIYLTAFSDQEMVQRAKATHSFGYIFKPLRERELETNLEFGIYKHKMEAELKETNRRLEDEIIERKQLEEKLQQAKKAADDANQAKSEFLASMSHELRTPLNAILGYAQILSHAECLTEKQREAIGTIQRSGEHLLSMITEILDLSKIEARKIELEPDEFHLPGLLKSLVEMIQIRAYHKGITFVADITPDLPTAIYNDQKRLRQILLNLLSNAVKFTEKGTVSLRVYELDELDELNESTTQQLNNSTTHKTQKLHFEVEDSGIGIPSEHIQKIFEPFQQVGDKHFHAEGTGLGLAISQQLARLMGSELHVESKPAQGSTFWFELDVCISEFGSGKTEENEIKPVSRIVGFRGENSGVLIVDDNDENRMILRDLLLPLGFEVFEAIDGREAIEKTTRFHPDLIFMDLIMPGVDGFEATRQIRKTEGPTPIIAVSASTFAQTKEESVAAGCHDFLAKPIRIETLLHCLQRHLKLEWIYNDDVDGHHSTDDVDLVEKPIIPPPQKEIAELYHLAIIGDILEIRDRVEKLDKNESQYTTFAAILRPLTKNLNILVIQQFLKRYLDAET